MVRAVQEGRGGLILKSDSSSGLFRKTSCKLRQPRYNARRLPRTEPAGAASLGIAMQDRPDEGDELKARLAKLTTDLQAQRDSEREVERKAVADSADKGLGQAMSLGFRVLSEFVAAIVVGAVIGWQFDRWFGTSPALLILFLGFGVAAGFWNVYRLAVPPQGRRGR